MNELVYMNNDEVVCDSLMVAEKFGKEHSKVIRSIEKILEGIPKSGDTPKLFKKSSYLQEQNGQRYKKYLMNRDGFSLLVMGFNGKKALEWKLKYIDAFNQMEKFLTEKQSQAWIETRKQGQFTRKSETDVIKRFVEYAKEQGSSNADKYYMIFSKLANKMADVESRDTATIMQLNNLSLIENIQRCCLYICMRKEVIVCQKKKKK